MNYVNIKILPRPHNLEFKRVGGLIFDINYADCGIEWKVKRWFNSKEQVHRENGPAIIWTGREHYWYRYGKLHCEDGPAVIQPSGTQFWCLNSIQYSKKDFNKEIRRRNELRESKNLTKTI